MTHPKITLGTHGFWGLRKLSFEGSDISHHLHVIGLTGMGKSKLLASTVVQLIRMGRPVGLIDPHSDLAEDVMAMLAEEGFPEKVYYVDFGRQDRYLPFNVLQQPGNDHDVARNVVETFKRAWPALAAGAAPQFENILLASTLTLVQNRLPITQLHALITQKDYRESLLQNVTDPKIVSFFHDRFDRWGKETPLMIESTLNKAFLLLFSPALRYTLGQAENSLNFRQLMDNGVSVLYNLGGLDEETQKVLGCLLTVGYEQAALSRADMSPLARTPYHLVMDEFSMFSAQSEESLSRILSLARKYGLYLTMAHQTWSQLSLRLAGALANTTSIAFRLGRSDAEWMARRIARYDPLEVKHEVSDEHAHERTHPIFWGVPETFEKLTVELETLPKRHAFVKLPEGSVEIKTLTLKSPQLPIGELTRLKESFARRLMKPREEVMPLVDAVESPIVTLPTRKEAA